MLNRYGAESLIVNVQVVHHTSAIITSFTVSMDVYEKPTYLKAK